MRRREFIALLGSAAAVRPLGARAERPLERILYFTHSAGYRHDVIPLSKAILTQLGSNSGTFEVTATEDMSEFSPENLERYAAVMFYTTGELPMSTAQKTALLNFVRSGHGFLGIHSATDTFYTWPDYLDLVGGYFNGHPWHQAVTIEVVDPGDPWWRFSGIRCNSRTKSTKSATSTIVNHTFSCVSTQARWTLRRLVCINDSMAGLSRGNGSTATGEYSIRRSATRRQSGRTPATSEFSRTLSSGLCEGRRRSRNRADAWHVTKCQQRTWPNARRLGDKEHALRLPDGMASRLRASGRFHFVASAPAFATWPS